MNNIPDTLLELLNQYIIEIPKIQRDYVQGRKDDDTKIVREKLLIDMKDAIVGKKIDENTGEEYKVPSLDLNFVYGKRDGDKFIPLDGQQRLTTLYLLHLFAFSKDAGKTELFNRFTYETRISSREFLKQINKHRDSIFVSSRPSYEIVDAIWFLSNWKYDPTIQSAMVMMDEIKEVFKDVDNLADRLESADKPLTFRFKDIDELGMEDSLYIKLNARGKALTAFENFKSQYIGRIDELDVSSDYKEDFKLKFDGSWTDVIWKDNYEKFDDVFLDFFEILFVNNRIMSEQSIWWNKINYQSLGQDIFDKTKYAFDFLCDSNQSDEIKKYIFIPIRDKAKSSYSDRVLFHALIVYLYKSEGLKSDGDLQGWMRIIRNLVVNSQINKWDLFIQAIEQINILSKHWSNLTAYFASDTVAVSLFNKEQLEEEKKKAQIILKDSKFADIIYKAEKHEYFRGQIRAALYLSEQDGAYVKNIFEQYWNKIETLFYSDKPKFSDNLLRRALLSIGNYLLPVASYYTLCIDDPYENSRTPSLRSLFSQHGDIVKKLLDSLDITKDIESQLKDIINNAAIQESDWRYCLVYYPKNFDRMSRQHLRLRKSMGNWIMVPNIASNGYNYDLYLNTLDLMLENRGLKRWFWGYYGTDVDRYMEIENYSINVRFESDAFVLSDNNDNVVYTSGKKTPLSDVMNFLSEKYNL